MRPFRLQSFAGRMLDDLPLLRRGKGAHLALVLLMPAMLSVFGLAGVTAAAAQPVPWHIVTSPDTSGSQSNYLNDVSCLSSASCVAVGYYIDDSGFAQTIIETLNDGSWSLTEGPDTSTSESNYLQSVSCTSSTACVAVGDYYDGTNEQTLIATLSGGTWSITTSPNVSDENNYLQGVSCTSSTACVAVGYYDNGSADQTLTEQLSGATWSITTSPNTSSSADNVLEGVSCTSSTACVAVGYYYNGSAHQTLMVTLSGTTWNLTEGPDTSTSAANELFGVSCTSSTSCVAVGRYDSGSAYQTLMVTLSGTTWSLTEGPDTSTSAANELSSVSCTSSTECVAVGFYYNGSTDQTLILTLSGTTWSLTEGPDTSISDDDYLQGVSCTSSTSCIAVGYYYADSPYQALILSTPLSQAITFSPSPPTSALFGSSITLDATGGGSGNPVTFSLDSTSTEGACDLSGTNDSVVTFTGAGNCVIDANQAGNNTYFAAPQVTLSIAVTYSEPCVSSYHALDVGPGQAICISPGAVIRGQINVGQGGSIDIEGASVYGSVTAKGAGVVRICDSKINGSVTVSSSTGPVIIGDEALGCSGNTINGPVSITSNTDGVCFDGNTVNGPLTVTGNTGSVWVTDDTVTGTEDVQT